MDIKNIELGSFGEALESLAPNFLRPPPTCYFFFSSPVQQHPAHFLYTRRTTFPNPQEEAVVMTSTIGIPIKLLNEAQARLLLSYESSPLS